MKDFPLFTCAAGRFTRHIQNPYLDNKAAMYVMTTRLLEQGHTRIICAPVDTGDILYEDGAGIPVFC